MTACLGIANAQVELSYCTDIEHGFGSQGTIYTPYVQFPAATVRPFSGSSLTRVFIGLNSDVTNVTIYIKNSPKDNRPIYSQVVGELHAGWNEVELTTPYTLADGEDLAIGYRARLSQDGGIGYSSVKNSLADNILINQSSQWTTCGGAVCLRAVLEGDALPQYEVSLDRMPDLRIDAGADSLTLTGCVHNMGTATISSYVLACSIDGHEAATVPVECMLPTNAADTFSIQLPQVYDFGTHNVTVSVLTVDGQADAYEANNTASFMLTIPDARFARRVVCEEYTGLWCGWCPKGLVGLEIMKHDHPDRFIAVSIHGGSNDPMEIPQDCAYTYYNFWTQFPGAPACKVNRRLSGDPYLDIRNLYRMETSTENHVALTCTAQWNADSTRLSVTAEIFTDADMATASYAMAYIVVEDSITGYYQNNYYAGDATPFYGWENKASYTDDVVFHDVARGIFPSVDGISAFEGKLTALQAYTHQLEFDLPAQVANPANIHVVCIVIDTHSGYIVNGHNVWPTAHPAAIHAVHAQAQTVSTTCYAVDGRQQRGGSQQHGLFIQRQVLTDGTTVSRKALIR